VGVGKRVGNAYLAFDLLRLISLCRGAYLGIMLFVLQLVYDTQLFPRAGIIATSFSSVSKWSSWVNHMVVVSMGFLVLLSWALLLRVWTSVWDWVLWF
jgi:hypothetical protein